MRPAGQPARCHPRFRPQRNSIVFIIESQVAYLCDAVATLRSHRYAAAEPRAEVQRLWNAELQRRMQRTVWNTGGCVSWYLDDTGRNPTIWPDYTFKFARRLRRFDLESYYQELVPTRDPAAMAPR